MNGHEATMKIAREHPELLPKLRRLFELSNFGVFSTDELLRAGISEDDMAIFKDYGLLQRANIIERKFK